MSRPCQSKIKIGDVFGKWIVIADAGYRNKSRKAWICKCSCGEEKNILQQSLLTGDSTQCRICGNRQKAKNNFRNLSKQQFGEWTVTDEYKTTESRKTYWKCICSCGKIKFVKTDSLTSGSSTRCGKCNSYEDIHSGWWDSKKWSAIRRNIEWKISQEYAWDLFEKQNKLCAITKLPIKLGKINVTASIDRKDSAKGYTEENVQWVHKIINTMKWSLNNEDFINLAKTIAKANEDLFLPELDMDKLIECVRSQSHHDRKRKNYE